jgi:ribosome maturation factor RimP
MAEITEKITAFLEPLLAETDVFIVNIKVKPVNNIKVYLDADQGLSIGKCATINRRLYASIEEAQLFPEGDFSLEVSSPGVDEPLTSERQYKKNIGRTVLVSFEEGSDRLGVLKEVKEGSLIIEEKIPKKKETLAVEIPLETIKKVVVQVVF